MGNLIELACTYNNGRSPLAEAFTQKYLEKIGIQEYKAISSGTHVASTNEMLAGNVQVPGEIVKMILEKGIERDSVHDKTAIENILKNENFYNDVSQSYALQIANKFNAEEVAYKEQAFKQFGLGSPKMKNEQTIIRPKSKIVLGMGKDNVKKINEIYDGESDIPIIETLAGYASGNPSQEFKSCFGGNLKDYLVMGEVIRGHVHDAIDRFLDR